MRYGRLLVLKILLIIFAMLSSNTFALGFQSGHLVLQLGAFKATQGKTQFVGINQLIGNNYVVNKHHDTNALYGLGYYIDGYKQPAFIFSYGIDAFYLSRTQVTGDVIQEQLFDNLSYHYNVRYMPIYAALKTTFNDRSNKFGLTFDLGIGPDLIMTNQYSERSLDGITIPDNAFNGQRKTSFSAMAGVGVKINNIFHSVPLECGYRFFSLGQGLLKTNNSQFLNNLETGKSTANALLCSVSF